MVYSRLTAHCANGIFTWHMERNSTTTGMFNQNLKKLKREKKKLEEKEDQLYYLQVMC